jgi:hypothetical protein
MIIPAPRNSKAPTVSIPAMRTIKIALYTSQDGETVAIPESAVRVNTTASMASTARPARRAV